MPDLMIDCSATNTGRSGVTASAALQPAACDAAASVTDAPVTVRTLDQLSALESVRYVWEAWGTHPNSDFAHYQLVCALRTNARPLVLLVERSGVPVALVAGRLERGQVAPRIGYFAPVRLRSTVLTVIYQGVLGSVDREAARAIVERVRALLGDGCADIAEFHHLSEHSSLLPELRTYEGRSWCRVDPAVNAHWLMAVEDESTFIPKKLRSKRRAWVRRKQRELEEAFPGQVTWTWMKQFDDIPALCRRLEEVAARTYQRELGAGFVDDEEHRRRFALFASRGELRVQLLEIAGAVRAYWIGTIYDGVFYSAETGYDPDLRNYEVGTQLFLRMVGELAREGVPRFDFGLGDAFYKQRFGDEQWNEVTVRLYASTMRGRTIAALLSIVGAVDRFGRRLAARFGILERVKTRWRRRLVQGKSEGDDALSER